MSGNAPGPDRTSYRLYESRLRTGWVSDGSQNVLRQRGWTDPVEQIQCGFTGLRAFAARNCLSREVLSGRKMLERRELFPNVIEMNYQARRRLGCCVYLIHDAGEWMLVDIGYEDTVDEIIDLIRRMDFPLAQCRYVVVSHADADHVQGLEKLLAVLPSATAVAHPLAIEALAGRDRILTYAEIPAQGISIHLHPIKIEQAINEGNVLKLGSLELEVWNTPGHTQSQLALRMGNLLFSGDNIFRDGGVGNIDAHHGSDIPAFIQSLERIRDADVEWLLPSHGPVFRKDRKVLQATIDRLTKYLHMSDFGTCAIDWPLLDEWEDELRQKFDPAKLPPARAISI